MNILSFFGKTKYLELDRFPSDRGGMIFAIPFVRMRLRDAIACLVLAFIRPPGGLAADAQPALIETSNIKLPESSGQIGFATVDQKLHHLLACHTRSELLDLFDLNSGALLKQIKVGKAECVGVDEDSGTCFVTLRSEKMVLFLDSATLRKKGEVSLPGRPDLMTVDPVHQMLYVAEDEGTNLWMIDSNSKKIVAEIGVPKGPEQSVYDPVSDQLFLAIKSTGSILVLDSKTRKAQAHWPTSPAARIHGLVLDPKSRRLYCAGANGKLVVLDAVTGRMLHVLELPFGVDQIAVDSGIERLYCASRTGVLSVFDLAKESPQALGEVKTEAGARTVVVDSKTHTVWVLFGNKKGSHLLRFRPSNF